MLYGLWLSAGGLQVNQHRQAVIANNLANLNTTGFKRDLAIFRERLIEAERGLGAMRFRNDLLDDMSGGTWLKPTATDYTQAPLLQGGPLDVAIQGDGFFTIQDGQETRYTRDGRFTLDPNGNLVTVAGGHAVLDRAGQPIHVGEARPEGIRIESAGRISIGDREVATLGVVDFADRSLLQKVGQNLFDGRNAEASPATGRLVQGFTEASGVEPTTELVQMIEAARLYQMNATMISYQDGMLGRTVNDVGRVA